MKLNLMGYANTLGYGIATLNILKSLVDKGVEVSFFPIGGIDDVPESFISYVLNSRAKTHVANNKTPTMRIAQQLDMNDWVGNGRRYALSFFELDRFTPEERKSLGNADVIFAPSQWAKSILLRDDELSAKPIGVIPMGVDRNIFSSKINEIPRFHVGNEVTTFINVGKAEVRKGHDFLLRAFNAAFEPSDSVRMIMVFNNPFIGKNNHDWEKWYRSTKMGSHFYFKNRLPNQAKLATIINVADAGFFPYRSEGWNLDLLECLSVGLPVIATDYSGPTEYLSSSNSYLIDVDMMEDAKDGVFFQGGKGLWAKLGDKQLAQTVVYLKKIHRDKQLGIPPSNEDGIATAKRFSWENTAQQIIKGLEL